MLSEKVKECSEIGKPYLTIISGTDDVSLEAVGKVFLEVVEELEYVDYVLLSTIKPVKDIATQLFGWNGLYDNKGVSLISAIESVGRLSDKNFWIRKALVTMDVIPAILDFVFISGSNLTDGDIEYVKNFERFYVSRVGVIKSNKHIKTPSTLYNCLKSKREYLVYTGTRQLDKLIKNQVRTIVVDMIASQYKEIKGVDFRDEHS